MNTDRFNKAATLALLWGAMLSSFVIRYALGVVAPTLMKLYGISPKTMGYILSGWNWALTASTLFAGPIVDRFGAWLSLSVGFGIWGLATAALPIASTVVSLFLMRALFGLGQTMLYPGTAAAVSRWFSPRERARAVAVVFSGTQVGLAISATVASLILARLGWRAVFYLIGGGSLLLALAWFWLYPDKHVGNREQPRPRPGRWGIGNRKNVAAAGSLPSWISLFRYRSTWGMALGQLGNLYAFVFFISWLPGYLILERKMTLLKSGLVGALPFWVGMFGTLSGGWLGDYLVRRGFTPTFSRKSIIGVGMAAATVAVIAAAFVAQTWLAVAFLILCMFFMRITAGSVNSIPIDLAPPPLVGSLSAIQSFFGNFGGLLAPIVTGYIVAATGSFIGALIAAGGMALFSAVSFVFVMGNLDQGLPYKQMAAKPATAMENGSQLPQEKRRSLIEGSSG